MAVKFFTSEVFSQGSVDLTQSVSVHPYCLLCFVFGTVPHYPLADEPWVPAPWEGMFCSRASPQHLLPRAGTPSAQQRCGWTSTSSTTMRPGPQLLASPLEGKLPQTLVGGLC